MAWLGSGEAAGGGFFGDGAGFAGDLVGVALDGGGEDQAGDGIAVGEQGLDEGFEIVHGGGGDLEQEIVAASEVMALADLFESLHVIDEAVIVLAAAAHTDEGENAEAESFAVDLYGVAAEDAGLFHLLHALRDGGGREADAATQLSKAEAGVGLELGEELSSVFIEQRRGFHGN